VANLRVSLAVGKSLEEGNKRLRLFSIMHRLGIDIFFTPIECRDSLSADSSDTPPM
jgi:hypothetical protein